MDVYQIVTDRIMELLETGTVPWHKPWNASTGFPRNLVTNKEYKGINIFLLGSMHYDCPFWLTFKQAADKGGKVRKGEKGTPVVFWKMLDADNDDPATGKGPKKIPFLRYYTVFNASQCDDLEIPSFTSSVPNNFNPIQVASDLVTNMPNPPDIIHGKTRACYSPTSDQVQMPYPKRFIRSEEYYSTLFHELTHATMHPSRLNRKCDFATFGDDVYSKEELVAEMGSAFLCAFSGIENTTIDNSAAYIKGWLKALKNDKKLIVMAATQAQKASDYIMNKQIPDEATTKEAA